MDFITDLPESVDPITSQSCSELWAVTDRFTKMAHFIPLARGTNLVRTVALQVSSARGQWGVLVGRGKGSTRVFLTTWKGGNVWQVTGYFLVFANIVSA